MIEYVIEASIRNRFLVLMATFLLAIAGVFPFSASCFRPKLYQATNSDGLAL